MATTKSENREIIDRYLECYNEKDLEGLEEVMTDDVRVTGLPGGMEVNSLDEYQEWAAGMAETFPDLAFEVEDTVSEGDRAAALVTATGTHEGGLMGIEPTGAEVEIDGTLYFRFSDGKINRKWSRTDDLGLLQQIGALPEEF